MRLLCVKANLRKLSCICTLVKSIRHYGRCGSRQVSRDGSTVHSKMWRYGARCRGSFKREPRTRWLSMCTVVFCTGPPLPHKITYAVLQNRSSWRIPKSFFETSQLFASGNRSCTTFCVPARRPGPFHTAVDTVVDMSVDAAGLSMRGCGFPERVLVAVVNVTGCTRQEYGSF